MSLDTNGQERRFAVRWYIHATHPKAGMVRGRTFYVSSSGLLFLAPVRYRIGDTLDMEIFIHPTHSVRCKARIAGEGSPCRVEFLRFYGDDFKTWNDHLLQILRRNLQKPAKTPSVRSLSAHKPSQNP